MVHDSSVVSEAWIFRSSPLGTGKVKSWMGISMHMAVGDIAAVLSRQASGVGESSLGWDKRIGRRLP